MECPKCYSDNIGQYRMPTGKVWCNDCGFTVLQKEIYNPFASGDYIKKFKEYKDATWDDLAKELVEFAPDDIDDFIYFLFDNSKENKKKDILNMLKEMS